MVGFFGISSISEIYAISERKFVTPGLENTCYKIFFTFHVNLFSCVS